MIMVLPTMFRATQNPDTPNLPFAQSLSPLMFRDNQNPNEPNLPFSQSPRGEKKYQVSIVGNGKFGNKNIASADLTQGGIDYWRSLGYTVTILGNTTPTTRTPTTPTPTGNNADIWKHIDKLYAIHGEQESRITDAYDHRTSIEGKVELGNTQRAEIHTKLSDLGRSVSDVSNALSVHSTHDLIPNPLGDILPYVLIGCVALLAMRKK